MGSWYREAWAHSSRRLMLGPFRADPLAHPLKTTSGKIEIYSSALPRSVTTTAHRTCLADRSSGLAARLPSSIRRTCCPDQPADKLHSQLDHGHIPAATKVKRPSADHDASRGRAARRRHRGTLVRVFKTTAAPALAAARLSDRIRAASYALSTGAVDSTGRLRRQPPLEITAIPMRSLDIGASK